MTESHYSIPAFHPTIGEQAAEILITQIDPNSDFHIHCYIGESDEPISAKGRDYFDALLNLRREAEKKEWKLCCFGSRLNTWPSGMARSMGQGLKAYALPPFGEQCKGRPVSIFDADTPEHYAPVEKQEQYAKDWGEALRQRNS